MQCNDQLATGHSVAWRHFAMLLLLLLLLLLL
jgi:hypothetical protein